MAAFNDVNILGFGKADRLLNVVENVMMRIAAARVYRETMHELSVLSNAELADIGINRSMIRSIAHEAAYGNR